MLPLKRDGTSSFVAEQKTTDLALGITTANSSDGLYRVCVKVEERGPVRFRIRRTSHAAIPNVNEDNGGLILLDNIIVSYPASSADLAPMGKYDSSRGGAQTLGQESAMANVPFPSVRDDANLVGRGLLTTYVSAGAPDDVDAASFVKGAKMLYRWRYLNQMSLPEDGSWKVLDMTPFGGAEVGIYTTTGTLSVTNEPGDIEFRYLLETSMPYYKYTDYSGLGIDLGGLYTEEKPVVTNAMASASRLPTCGSDWFVRMREGASDWEGVEVVLSGGGYDLGTRVPMELVGDHVWRGIAQVPLGAAGDVGFLFAATNRQTAGSTEFSENLTLLYPGSLSELPGRGEASATGDEGTFPIDTVSRCLEFMFNDETFVYSVGHAEYQDFNAWHDAHRDDGKFVGTSSMTSGVSSAVMVRTNADISAWNLYNGENEDWNEAFDLNKQYDTSPAFPKNVFYGGHDMPKYAWRGESGIFVDAKLTASNAVTHNEQSGIAWQMRGGGDSAGCVYFSQSDGPVGLDEVSFKARLEQSISFNDFSYWHGGNAFTTNNYTLVVPALMSCNATKESRDYAPNASMSVVGFYTPWSGCYEARATRSYTEGITISIYKWYMQNYRMTNECLVSQWFSGNGMEHDGSTAYGGRTTPQMYAMLLSLGEDTSGNTIIIAGLTTQPSSPIAAKYGDGTYNLVCAQDGTTTRHRQGTYGVLTTGCNGFFYYPRQRSSRITTIDAKKAVHPGESVKPSEAGGYNADDCQAHLDLGQWSYPPARAERFETSAYSGDDFPGIRPPSDFVQTVGVYLKKRGDKRADWSLFKEVDVLKYDFETVVAEVHTNISCDIKLMTGGNPVDVTVWDIRQTSWTGEDIKDIADKPYEFVYTKACVDYYEVEEGVSNKCVKLQPSRGIMDIAQSVRSPILTNGLGMVSFSYLTNSVKKGCEIWVQAATNDVRRNTLSSDPGYNTTTKEVALGEVEPELTWITLKKYNYDDLVAANGQISYYCGWHSTKEKLLQGVFRITVAPDVVVAAQSTNEVEWGSIKITGMEVHDEPALDDASWIGWNLRTLGDAADGEKRMFLPDIKLNGTATGLSAGLNNSVTKDIAGDTIGLEPAIQAPTFGGNASIGQVRFRARLYETNAVLASLTNATVTLYGSADGSGDSWSALTNYTVESTVYRIFEYATVEDGYKAVKLVVSGVKDGTYEGDRVLIDEIVVSERPEASVSFVYARPFRDGINADRVVSDILSREQQPLSGESWGVQTKIKYDSLSGDIDADKGFKVLFRYFRGNDPWGYNGGWRDSSSASAWAELVPVGDPADLVFRSSLSNPGTIVEARSDANAVVQFVLVVRYYLRGVDVAQEKMIAVTSTEGEGWTNPSWYSPIDYNAKYSGGDTNKFVPYTILDPVSPGRAWINEVNYNDGDRSQNGGNKSETNQFVEIAVPSGVDMTGWKLRMTDINMVTYPLLTLGDGAPATKTKYGVPSGDYDLYVVQSPATASAGGIRDRATGNLVADATWNSESTPKGVMYPNTIKSGTLQYYMPYQFELLRPSGIVEHQIVVGGTNEWRGTAYGNLYDGTNLVHELDVVIPSEKRFYAGDDNARKADGATFSSFGVTGSAHGEEGGWSAEMVFTPGRFNEGQDELENWYLPPLGSTLSVYARTLGGHIHQTVEDETSDYIRIIMYSGGSTNIDYTIDTWYAISNIAVWAENGKTNYYAADVTGSYRLYLHNVTQTTYVVASEGIDPRLPAAGFDPSGRYAPAIMNWLSAGMADDRPFANQGGDVYHARFKGLNNADNEFEMSLEQMYWLDIDPTMSNWWLRAGISDYRGEQVVRRRKRLNGDYWYYTNLQVRTKMYLSNDVTGRVYAPYRLQGLANEQSDTFTGNSWTSETFMVELRLNNGLAHNVGFMPFRWFTFDHGSFSNETAGVNAYTSLIEVMDPFTTESPGYSYGWYDFRDLGTSALFLRWNLDERSEAQGVERLDADSSYDGTPYERVDD